MQFLRGISISDSGWAKFLTHIEYKDEWYVKTFIQ
jgi:transposase